MIVLIIEDDDDKRSELENFISQTYTVEQIISARSLQSGLRAIHNSSPNFILLDMTMRNFDRAVGEEGGRPHPFAGREILRQMKRNRIDIPVIVVTHFDRFGEEKDFVSLDQLKDELARSYTNYIDTVQYKSNIDQWRSALDDVIGSRLHKRSP